MRGEGGSSLESGFWGLRSRREPACGRAAWAAAPRFGSTLGLPRHPFPDFKT